MLALRRIVEDFEGVRAGLARRSAHDAELLGPILELAQQRRRIIAATEKGAAQRNTASKAMASLVKDSQQFAQRREELKALSTQVKALDHELSSVKEELDALLVRVPNLPDPSVPDGGSADDNRVVRVWSDKPDQPFEVQPHYQIGVDLGVLDFERAAKLAGSRFTVSFGAAAKLERALIGFMLDLHTAEHGYTEVLPPFLVKGEALFGTGQLPKFEADLFKTRKNDPKKSFDLYLNPTAEVPLTNLHAGEILAGDQLPLCYAAYTPCFRSEAGSYGQDVRGMIRQHQFNKVELVRICRPEQSLSELEVLVGHAEAVLEKLDLHYRRVLLCSGDMGFSAAKTYDLEVWLPAQGRFREISSCSTCSDFQARRANIRYRPQPGEKPCFVHTLNGSGLAVGRTVIAILEQYQQADGSVVVPEALRAAMGCERISRTP